MLSSLNLEPGNIVGGYTLISRLGGGAMGSVWRVRDDGGNVYAMKILRDSLAEDEDTIEPIDSAVDANVGASAPDSPQRETNAATARERLRREATALRKIDHPGVCRIEDMELDDSLAFIVTELIEGNNLRQDVALNGRYVAQDLERLAAKLMDAVAAVHNAGIIHRDIKPTNVMVAITGPMLVDFGIAMGEGESHVTRTGLVMGTPGFIAPEIIDGAESDEITDWWSTAAVLAFAATGKPVFGSKPMMAVLERAASGHADLSGLPQRTAEAFRRALNPDRSQRCTPQELLQAITADAMQPEVWEHTEAAPAVPVAGKGAVLQQGPHTAPPAPPVSASMGSLVPGSTSESVPELSAPASLQDTALPPNPPSTEHSATNTADSESDQGKVVRPFGVNSSDSSPILATPPSPTIANASNSSQQDTVINPRLAWQNTPLPNLALVEQSLAHAMPTTALPAATHALSAATTVLPQASAAMQESTAVMPYAQQPSAEQSNTQIIAGTTPMVAQTTPLTATSLTTPLTAGAPTTPLAAQTTVMPAARQAQPLYDTQIQAQIQNHIPYEQPTIAQPQIQQYAQPQFIQPQYAEYAENNGQQLDAQTEPEPYAIENGSNNPSNSESPSALPSEALPAASLSDSINPAHGKLLLLALLVPLCLLAACAPTWAIIIGSIALWLLTTLGMARLAFVSRIEKRGKRGSSDMLVALGALPWHAVKAILTALPSALVLIACSTVVSAMLTIALHLPTTRTQTILFDLPVSMPLVVGAPASLSGLALMAGYACGWFASTWTANSYTIQVGAAALRETCCTTKRPRLRWFFLIMWIIITLAGLATTLASSSLDWYPFASFFE